MNKKEITEIKRRLKKESCTFTRMCGCYVNNTKEKVLDFGGPFWDVDEEEKFKYIEIANKALSGKLGNNLVEMGFTLQEETEGESHKLIAALLESKLKDESLIDAFYDHVIKTYITPENYLILLFHDAYDVPLKTSDNMKLDDSEEIYEYIICAICPVALSKAGLGYNADEKNFSMMKRNWAVGPVETAFTFPCFNGRRGDIHAVLAYTKDAKNPHHEFWEEGLGAIDAMTSVEKRTAFQEIVKKEFAADGEDGESALISVAGGIHEVLKEAESEGEKTQVFLQKDKMEEVLADSGIDAEKAHKISENYDSFFKDDVPSVDELVDEKAAKESEIRSERKNLMEEISDLNEQNARLMEMTSPVEYGESDHPKVILRVSEEKAEQIRTTTVDGTECILVPLSEDEETIINGRTVKL